MASPTDIPRRVWSWVASMLEQTGALRFTAGWNFPTAQVSVKLGKCFSQEGDAKGQLGTTEMTTGPTLLEHPASLAHRAIPCLGRRMALALQVPALRPLSVCFPPHYVAPGFSFTEWDSCISLFASHRSQTGKENIKKKLPNVHLLLRSGERALNPLWNTCLATWKLMCLIELISVCTSYIGN